MDAAKTPDRATRLGLYVLAALATTLLVGALVSGCGTLSGADATVGDGGAAGSPVWDAASDVVEGVGGLLPPQYQWAWALGLLAFRKVRESVARPMRLAVKGELVAATKAVLAIPGLVHTGDVEAKGGIFKAPTP